MSRQNNSTNIINKAQKAQQDLKNQIINFCNHWRCLTSQTQSVLIAIIKKIIKDNKIPKNAMTIMQQLIVDKDEQQYFTDIQLKNTQNIVNTFSKLLRLSNFNPILIQYLKQLKLKNEKQINIPTRKYKKFNALNALHPDYKLYCNISRYYQNNVLEYDQMENQNANSKFYKYPRLFLRGQILKSYQTKSQNKGILLMTIEGQHIIGRKGLAISNGSSIQWWMRRSESYQGVVSEKQENMQIQQHLNKVKQLRLEHKFIGHDGPVTAMSLSLDQFYLISAALDNIIKLWCLRTKMLLTQYKGHINCIWSLSFNESGFFFLSGSADKTIKLWKTDGPLPVRIFTGHKGDVYKTQFLKNPDYIISCSSDKTVRIWGLQKADCLTIINFERQVTNFTISFSGRYLVVCENTGMMTFSDLLNGEELNSFNLFFLNKKCDDQQKKKYPIHDMSFSHDETEFACISKKQIALYSIDLMKQKMAADIYQQLKQEKMSTNQEKNYHVKPKQILDFGNEQLNLIYCNYHPKNILIVAGKK